MVLLVAVGYEDPIWPTKEDTDSSYHRVVGVMTEQIKAGKANLMVATHNEATVHFVLNRYVQEASWPSMHICGWKHSSQ